MSINLSIKGVPDAWAQRLRERAARHHRSLQGELMALLGAAVGDDTPASSAGVPPVAARLQAPPAADRLQAPPAVDRLTLDDLAQRARSRFGGLAAQGGRSADIVRALRDEADGR